MRFVCIGKFCDSRDGGRYAHPCHSWRRFLAIVEGDTDKNNDKLSFDVGDNHIEFDLFKAPAFPFISDNCHKVDVIDKLTRENITNPVSSGPFDHYVLSDDATKDENP